MKKIILLLFFSLFITACQSAIQNNNKATNNINININQNNTMSDQNPTASEAILKTNLGDITVEFYLNDAPKTVANFVKLAKEGFYDGTRFHRVIKDFMIQGGDPLSKDVNAKSRWGTGGPDYKFADEINSHLLVRGSLAMANAGPNTNGSQFFIVTAVSTPWLDGHHTNFGQVVSGMDVVEKIENSQTDSLDRPIKDVIIESIQIK